MEKNPPAADTFRILIASDIHLGFEEKDPIRGEDSFNTFEEILNLGRENDVDLILLGGDLFHDNKPSAKSLHKCLALFRRYCMGDRPISVEFMSDPTDNFRHCEFPVVNYEDPNLNISTPIFSIHGNHDDPSGAGRLSAIDLLSVSGFMNYFGKWTDLTNINVSPILLRKGCSRLALYGLSYIKDERLFRLFGEKKVKLYRPREATDEWFNIFVLHQNRAMHGEKCYVPEDSLPDFLDLVLWGHEHECRIHPERKGSESYFITQPGSPVATSLCKGESVEKHVGILSVYKKKFNMKPIKLKTVRPFVLETITLSESSINLDEDKATGKVMDYVKEYVEGMIESATKQETGHEKQPTLPLIRLRVEYLNEKHVFNIARFGQNFHDRVANVGDIVLFRKERVGVKKEENFDEDAMRAVLPMTIVNADWDVRVESVVEKYFKQPENSSQLQVLSAKGMVEAMMSFVDKDDKDAPVEMVNHQVNKTVCFLKTKDVDENNIEDEVKSFQEQRQQRSEEEVAEARQFLQSADRQQPRPRGEDTISDRSFDSDTEDKAAAVRTTSRGRGQGRGRGRSRNASRGRGRGSAANGFLDDDDDDDDSNDNLPVATSTRGRGRGRGSRGGQTSRGRGRGKNAVVQSSIMDAFSKQSQNSTRSSSRAKKGIVYDISDSD